MLSTKDNERCQRLPWTANMAREPYSFGTCPVNLVAGKWRARRPPAMLGHKTERIMDIGYAIAFDALAGLTVLTLGLVARRIVSGRSRLGVQNLAEALVTAGHLLGSFLVVAAALAGCVTGQDLVADIAWTALFGGTGVVLLALMGRIGTELILGARLGPEIARGNAAAGLAAASHKLATGILIGSCLYGRDL